MSESSPPSSDPEMTTELNQARQFQSVSVTRFEIDHLRNFVVLLDHYPHLKGAAGDLQTWIEDKTSRPALFKRRETEPTVLEQVLSATGIEIDDDGSERIWWVSADPGPVQCYSLTDALRAWQHLAYVDATRDLARKFPHRDIPIHFSAEPRTIRRWQIDIGFSGAESPTLLDATEAAYVR